MTRYDLFYFAVSPVLLPYLAWRWIRRGKYHQSAPGMLGRRLPSRASAEKFSGGSVWIHAVSVGEIAAARAIEPHLRCLYPKLPFVISTITETGQEAARRALPHVEGHTFFPVDLSWNVNRFFRIYRPRVIVLLEAEIWPNFLTLARESDAKVFLVNGRMSDRSYPRYLRAQKFVAPIFDCIGGYCVQTDEDRRRFETLGISTEKIRVTGNCKFDLHIEPWTPQEKTAERAKLGIREDRPVVVAGSTHAGEEELILDAFREARNSVSDLCLILAPRHPERFMAVADLARQRGFRVRLATETAGEDGPEVVILNKMGVLARAYGLGDVAIVAGSFCKIGGHNLLEAAAHKIPVVYGPNMKSQRELARLFMKAGAGIQVSPQQLAPALVRLLTDPAEREREGLKVFQVLQANQGSAARSAEMILEWTRQWDLLDL